MDPLLFTAPGRIRILLVPVHPIKAHTFQKYVELVKKFGVVKLGDVTPDMRGTQKTMFSAQAFHEGQLHFNFITNYEAEHAYLEEFQMHRKIFGVIGIMDCQEFSNLPDGFSKFSEILKNYPTAIAHRCFAFNPAETQPDDTKGLIMLPNFGDMGFYMSTMICDFASNILTEFGNVASMIEKKTIINSPKIPSISSTSNSNTLQPSSLSTTRYSKPANSYSLPDLRSPPPIPLTPPSQAMTTVGIGGTTVGVNSKDNPYQIRSTLGNIANQAAMVPNTVADLKLKRRAPGRIQKLIADLYLMSGRLPDAVTNYYIAIDTTRNNSDYLWQAAALEGLCVALILLAYLHADIGPQVLQAPPSPNTNPPSSPSSPIGPKPLWTDITEKYINVITLYAKTSNSAHNQVPPLVYTESCLKLAKMLSSIWIVGQWGDDALKVIVHGGPPSEKNSSKKWGLSQMSGVTRTEISQWAMKGYGAFVEEMTLTEQIYITTTIASIFSTINFRRKHAFFLRQAVLLILPIFAKPQNSSQNLLIDEFDSGIISCLAKVTDVYGVGDESKIDKPDIGPILDDDPLLNFGWPAIQIDVMKDAISLTEALPDISSAIKYTTRLLRRLFLHLPKEEQHRLSISLPRLVSLAKKQGFDMDVKYWGMNLVRAIEVCRPTLRKVPYPHSSKLFTMKMADEQVESNDGPFIYNPFSKKTVETVQTHLVANETAYFMVTLANPFAVDLDIQSISISTSGIAFKPNIVPTSIPANTSIPLRLSGIPKEAGGLIIRGCKIKVYGCLEQEFCVFLPPKEDEIKRKEKDEELSKRIKKSGLAVIDRHRRVDSQGSTSSISTAATSVAQNQYMDFLKVDVIDDQPLLKIKSTSLMHGAVMLFEGEKTEMTIKLENIGKIPVNFITLSFHDSTLANAQAILNSADIPAEEAYEMELYAHRQPVFSWDQMERKINLLPGNEQILNVKLFGKRGCTYGTIQIDYGYLDRPDSPPKDIFFTRQVFYPILLTVHQHLEPLAMDVLNFKPIAGSGSLQNGNGYINVIDHRKQVEELLKISRFSEKSVSKLENEYCLLTFDIRNVWHIPFEVTYSVDEVESPNYVKISTTVEPSSTARIVLPIKRIALNESDATKPIPSLFDKQFVVSKGPKTTIEQERLHLALFWYRENLLKKLTTTWRCPISHREGTVDIRSLRLNKSMLNILRINEVSFFVEIRETSKVVKLALNRFKCPVNEFIPIRFVVFNRQEKPIKLCIRIQPVQSYSDGLMECDLSGRMVWNGLLQTPLPKIEPKSSTTYILPVCFFSRGDFQFLYHCEDIVSRAIGAVSGVYARLNFKVFKRPYSTHTCHYGVCFDIDGVLIKGKKVLPETREALSFLSGENPLQKKIPFILLTNGGGTTEVRKAVELSKLLEFPISSQQLVLSHSPMRSLVPKYENSMVLIVGGGGDSCREVAESYGFKKVVTPLDITTYSPSIWPHRKIDHQTKRTVKHDFLKEPIQAIMMFHDSWNWGRDVQIITDLLRSKDGYIGTLAHGLEENLHQMPVYFSNPDFIWSNDFPIPRFGQGAFRKALEVLFEEMTGRKLKYELFGKPETPTYRYAEQILENWAFETLKDRALQRHTYAIGDNPAADIAGANAHNWTSILVRTGVFQGKENDDRFPADFVAQHVLEAVQWVFSREEGM
ncbi:hypothetical protein G9A89_010827 [Geosiphon pyriformis]|nr:hypothetical protein G9A89_010827 [Geosiphon pyriformis]